MALNDFKPLLYEFLLCPIDIQYDIQDDIQDDTQDDTQTLSLALSGSLMLLLCLNFLELESSVKQLVGSAFNSEQLNHEHVNYSTYDTSYFNIIKYA